MTIDWNDQAVVFVTAMLGGMVLYELLELRLRARRAAAAW